MFLNPSQEPVHWIIKDSKLPKKRGSICNAERETLCYRVLHRTFNVLPSGRTQRTVKGFKCISFLHICWAVLKKKQPIWKSRAAQWDRSVTVIPLEQWYDWCDEDTGWCAGPSSEDRSVGPWTGWGRWGLSVCRVWSHRHSLLSPTEPQSSPYCSSDHKHTQNRIQSLKTTPEVMAPSVKISQSVNGTTHTNIRSNG